MFGNKEVMDLRAQFMNEGMTRVAAEEQLMFQLCLLLLVLNFVCCSEDRNIFFAFIVRTRTLDFLFV